MAKRELEANVLRVRFTDVNIKLFWAAQRQQHLRQKIDGPYWRLLIVGRRDKSRMSRFLESRVSAKADIRVISCRTEPIDCVLDTGSDSTAANW